MSNCIKNYSIQKWGTALVQVTNALQKREVHCTGTCVVRVKSGPCWPHPTVSMTLVYERAEARCPHITHSDSHSYVGLSHN